MKFSRSLLLVALAPFPPYASAPLHAQSSVLTCTSDDGYYHYCRVDTQNRVNLVKVLNGRPCKQDYSWGFDYRGIWVDRGCRAQFTYGVSKSNDDTGSAVAAGILGAIIVGAIAAGASSDDHSDGHYQDNSAALQRDYYRDGYRMGQRDWDNNLPPYYMAYRNRFPREYESSFAAGYDAGYNNRRDDYYTRDPYSNNYRYRPPPTNDPNYGTINNPGHGVSGVEPHEKIIYCADNSGHGNHCNAITAGGVDLVQQKSGSPCRENYSWGVDNSGIWVSLGCRANFVLHGVAAH